MTRPDGTRYGLHTYYQRHAFGDWQRIELQGGFEHADGRREPFAALVPELEVDPTRTAVCAAACCTCTMADGSARDLTVTALLGDTGFHLGDRPVLRLRRPLARRVARRPARRRRAHRRLHDVETARRLHQLRDCIVRVDDPVGGGIGVGNLQSIVVGAHPEIGLTQQASFM